MATLSSVIRRGTRAAQPAASAVAVGTLYYVTDESKIERSTGSAWESYSAAAGAGTVDTSGTPATGNLAKFSDADTITNADLTGDVTTAGGVAATIANDAVSYAKMQDVSAASKLLGRGSASGAGDPQEITLGTNLSMSGTTLNATGGGGGGGLVLLEQHAASASAQLDFTTAFDATYDEYMIELIDILPATNATKLLMLCSTDGGSTFDTAGNYDSSFHRWSKTAASQAGFASGTSIDLGGDLSISNDATEQGLSGSLKWFNPLGTSGWHKLTGQTTYWYNGTPELLGNIIAGAYKSASAVNALRFKMSSGNIASGTIRVYGIAKT